ncbi:type IV pilus (Tfp) assembly protein PilQ [Legionella quinlivanii]|uniref:Type IV pilus (Tfp) assembly protein PilQ n=1 Tax=Legionella quinlivanii TaxID=45073 RepID=A0A0W0Y252_9GAMM|nr:type IV pilus secretin PilQ family protein [Legionella quinlivanii]KTD50638.1 type IV pilus (Tfp) assembly protein PilQ [Legionella quinlivanii]MCW8450271.1 type IV pilus secretin PilQ family protein [Legionella quinlivanii]SEG35212.1 type IV pilus assembly protein PilQ [Legionella quinlivanii DSM 21216]STY11579.1 type IV pilus assembly protein PilQ [Legionella quinlivanii]
MLRKLILIALFMLVALSKAMADTNTMTGIKVIPLPDERVRVDFCFTSPLKNLPASFITQKPPRLVLDFIQTKMVINEKDKSRKIEIGSLTNYNIVAVGDRVRAILDLTDSISYSGQIAGNTYSLTLSGKSHQIFQQRREIFVSNRPVNARHGITNLDFRGTGAEGGRVIIDVTDASIPIDVTQTGKEVVVNFMSTQIPPRLIKRFDVADFQSPAQLLSLQQDGKNARLTIISKGDYGHYAYQVNKQFIVEIYPLSAEEAKQAKLKKMVFTGKRISLNFQNIQIRAVLQLLAEFTGINIVVSDQVQGSITLRLNDIPWDQALDIILKTNALDKRKTGNVLLIDKASNLLEQEKNALKAQQAVTNLAPLRSELIQINYAKAADIAVLLKDKNNSLLSKRGTLSVDARTNTIWIQDTGVQIEEIRELVKQLDIPVKQVLIEARIVNVTKDFARDLGIRFGISRPTHLSGTLSGANQLAQNVAPADVVPLSDRLNVDLAATPVSASPASVGLALAKLGDGILLDLELSALESEGRGEVISSPRLITTNQQSAVIESGEEIPYQEATSSGATAVAFKKAVLSLKVTPQITPDNKIMMDLQINQDTPSPQTFNGVPAILTKEIQTNVLVNNGQTIVLGGIYKQDKNNSINRVPFLGNLPVVGVLFRNQSTEIKNEELLIFITPRIITNTLSITTVEGKGVELNKFGRPAPWK